MENIHEFDNEQITNIKDMLNSWNVDNIRMALTFLNNADFRNTIITEQVSYLMNTCPGLRFAIFNNAIDGSNRVRFHFEDKRIDAGEFKDITLFVDDESTSESIHYHPVPYPLDKITMKHNGGEINY